MTTNTNTVIVDLFNVPAYPQLPQVTFGSPRKIAIANDDPNSYVFASFDGINDAVRLMPAQQGFADVEIEFDDFYEQVWLRSEAVPTFTPVTPVQAQVVGEEVKS